MKATPSVQCKTDKLKALRLGLFVVGGAVSLAFVLGMLYSDSFAVAMLILLGAVSIAIVVVEAFWQKHVKELVQVGEQEAVGTLLELFFADARKTRGSYTHRSYIPTGRRQTVCYQLTRLLPKMRPEAVELLTRRQRRQIHALVLRADASLCMASLKFLQQYGEEEAVPVIQKLLSYETVNVHVSQEAEACLAVLLERSRWQEHHHSLLRASEELTQAQKGILLRATSEEAQAGQEGQLLRASVAGQE